MFGERRTISNRKPKPAVYIAGDANILFPAIVAIESIRRHNPQRFDYFICMKGELLTSDERLDLRKRKIEYVDLNELADFRIEERLRKMGRWPVEVFYNWAVPYHLAKLGYDHCVKCDYDILCVGTYDELDVMLPRGSVVSGLFLNVNVFKDLSEEMVNRFRLEVGADPSFISYMNVGWGVIDTRLYVEHDIFEKFCRTYSLLDPDTVNLADQVAAAIVFSSLGPRVHKLPTAYNQRVRYLPQVDLEGRPNIKNVHYITMHKPWKALSQKTIDDFVVQGEAAFAFYRILWLQEAATVRGFKKYCEVPVPTPMEQLAISQGVLRKIQSIAGQTGKR